MMKVLPYLLLFILLAGITTNAQKRTLSGTVNSAAEKSGLAGFSILVKGSSTGTKTNENGSFQITTDYPNPVLVFSAVGYEKKEVEIGAANVINIELTEVANQLSQVTVSALGFKERSD